MMVTIRRLEQVIQLMCISIQMLLQTLRTLSMLPWMWHNQNI
jgi:hypothetical protein